MFAVWPSSGRSVLTCILRVPVNQFSSPQSLQGPMGPVV